MYRRLRRLANRVRELIGISRIGARKLRRRMASRRDMTAGPMTKWLIMNLPNRRYKPALLTRWAFLFRRAGTDWANPVIPWVAIHVAVGSYVADPVKHLRRLQDMDPESRHLLALGAQASLARGRPGDSLDQMERAQDLLTRELQRSGKIPVTNADPTDLCPVAPSFAVLGMPKSASTSLQQTLTRHPDVLPTVIKEPKTHVWLPGRPDIYRACYPKVPVDSLLTAGDFNIGSLARPELAPVLRDVNPDMRLLVLHRDPAERCRSAHRMRLSNGATGRPWATEVSDLLEAHRVPPTDIDGVRTVPWAFQASLFLPFLREWLRFFSADQLAIVRFEAIVEGSDAILDEILDHLRLRPAALGPMDRLNRSRGPAPPQDAEATERLSRWFEEHERRVWELIDREGVRVIGA